MILYNSDYFGLPQLVTFSGSAVYRTTLPSLISTGVFFIYKYTFGAGDNRETMNDDEGGALYTIHPFVIAIYILAFSLIINHRLNYCYQRYWESCSSIFMMSSKWMDSATALAAFHYQSTVYDEDRPHSFGTDDTCRDRWNYRGMRPSALTSLNGDALDRTAASDSSDSGSSSVSLSEEPSGLTTSEALETSLESFRSFLSRGSRERRRRYSQEEQYERTKERFSSRGSIFNWKRLGKRGFENKSSLPDLEEASTQRQNGLMSEDFMGKAPRTNVSRTPQKSNLSELAKNQYSKRHSMPVGGAQTKERSSMAFTFGRYGGKWTSDKNLDAKSKEPQSHRTRLPSTDIPLTGAGGAVIKSFKPNPSLDWQKKHYTSLPSNTGLHSTFYQTPLGFDFQKQLLEEERERKQARQREINASRQRPGVRRNRSSLPNLRKSMARAIGTGNIEITENSERIASDPTRGSFSIMNNNSDKSSPNSMKRPTLPNFIPRLELHDLPSLHGRPSAKKAKVESDDESLPNPISPFSPGFKLQNNMTAFGSDMQRPPSLRLSMKKMNGRASLFLQEAAHLFSLMSAVAMASLRADIEGVQSPLEDYVPGQRFPPVNPEEIRVKVFITKKDGGNGSVGSERGIKFKRKNAFTNILMFLLGTSRNSRQRTIYNASRPFSVLGGVSDAEVAMLRKVRGHSAQHALCCLWLREFITREYLDGSTGGVAPPIVARVYQHISDGTQQYNNCRKTAFTDFPFPHAQLTSFFGFASLFIFPLLYFTYVNSTAIGVLMNIFTVGCFLGILEVALELEQPFIRYPNDLPLNNYQAQFNEALISSLYGGFHPDAWGKAVDNGGLFSTTTCSNDGANENSGDGEESRITSSARSSLKTTTSTDGPDEIIGSEVNSSLERIVEVTSPNHPEQNIVQYSDL